MRGGLTPNSSGVGAEMPGQRWRHRKIRITSEHPFWGKDRAWVETAKLLPGDEVFTSAGGWVRVSNGTWVSQQQTVYNFEVEGFHSYFVGKTGLWVHNTSCPASVDELIEMMNKRKKVKAEYAGGDMEKYLKLTGNEASHVLDEYGNSLITLRKDVATRWTAFHEWLHRYFQRKNGGPIPGEDDMIEKFFKKHKKFFKLECE